MSLKLVRSIDVIFGIPGVLPVGFRYQNPKPMGWLLAVGPDGRKWYVGEKQLTLCGEATPADYFRTGGEMKPRTRYIDQRQVIPIA